MRAVAAVTVIHGVRYADAGTVNARDGAAAWWSRSRTIRVVELSSSSTTSDRDRRKSLKDLKPNDFSLNDGSIRFICALTAELCSQSTSSFSRPIRSARVSSPVAAACGSGVLGFLGGLRLALRPPSVRLGRARRACRLEHRNPGQRVVDDELVARRRQRPARRAGHADAHDVPAQPLAALRQRDVVGVAGDDHHVGQVGQPEHVLDGVDGQPDVGAVLAVRGGREQLHQIDRAADQLPAVAGVDLGRPVRVGAGEHQRAERRGEVDDGADVDGGPVQPVRVLVQALGLVLWNELRPFTWSYREITMLSKSR